MALDMNMHCNAILEWDFPLHKRTPSWMTGY